MDLIEDWGTCYMGKHSEQDAQGQDTQVDESAIVWGQPRDQAFHSVALRPDEYRVFRRMVSAPVALPLADDTLELIRKVQTLTSELAIEQDAYATLQNVAATLPAGVLAKFKIAVDKRAVLLSHAERALEEAVA